MDNFNKDFDINPESYLKFAEFEKLLVYCDQAEKNFLEIYYKFSEKDSEFTGYEKEINLIEKRI